MSRFMKNVCFLAEDTTTTIEYKGKTYDNLISIWYEPVFYDSASGKELSEQDDRETTGYPGCSFAYDKDSGIKIWLNPEQMRQQKLLCTVRLVSADLISKEKDNSGDIVSVSVEDAITILMNYPELYDWSTNIPAQSTSIMVNGIDY